MSRKNIIYIGLLLIVTLFVSVTYFSYAFFTHKDEQHGKLNIVAGTLSYEIESEELITFCAKFWFCWEDCTIIF